MKLNSLNLYGHFLDREVRESVGYWPSQKELWWLLSASLLVAPGTTYCSYASLWESNFGEPEHREFIRTLMQFDALTPMSSHPTPEEFLETRQRLYQHDRDRYSIYFETGKSAIIRATPPRLIVPNSTTSLLFNSMVSWSSEASNQDPDHIVRAKHLTDAVLRDWQGKAITAALFRPNAGSDQVAFEVVRRRIAETYIGRYTKVCMADIVTGIPGLHTYDNLSTSFPSFDLPLLRKVTERAWVKGINELYDIDNVREILRQRLSPIGLHFKETWKSLLGGLSAASADREEAAIAARRNLIASQIDAIAMHHRPADAVGYEPLISATEALLSEAKRIFGSEFFEAAAPAERVLLVVATDIEQEELLELLKSKASIIVEAGEQVPLWSCRLDCAEILVTRCEIGQLGTRGSLLTTDAALEAVAPGFCFLCGICMGFREEESRIGDLIVASRIIDCETGKSLEGEMIHKGGSLEPDSALVAAARLTAKTSDVHFGSMLTGTKVINDRELRGRLKREFPESWGLDMEGYGVASACHNRRVPFLMVKSICDWGFEKTDVDQREAAKASFSFVLEIIGNLLGKRSVIG